jgi:hypothetical protein
MTVAPTIAITLARPLGAEIHDHKRDYDCQSNNDPGFQLNGP